MLISCPVDWERETYSIFNILTIIKYSRSFISCCRFKFNIELNVRLYHTIECCILYTCISLSSMSSSSSYMNYVIEHPGCAYIHRYRFDISFLFIFAPNIHNSIPGERSSTNRILFAFNELKSSRLLTRFFSYSLSLSHISFFQIPPTYFNSYFCTHFPFFICFIQMINKIEPMWNEMLTIAIKVTKKKDENMFTRPCRQSAFFPLLLQHSQ